MREQWQDSQAGQDEISQLVYLSHLIGGDETLVQPGGGNTSVKLEADDLFGSRVVALAVKGSGTDLRTIGPEGFTYLYLDRLAALRGRQDMRDEEMMRLMRACMLRPEDPLPSVETPLHALLPARFIAHTHDVATLCLTDTPSAQEHVRRLFADRVAFLEYVRPGFPLAKRLAERYPGGPGPRAIALVMEKHGLTVWGETAAQCYARLLDLIGEAEAYVAERARGKAVFGPCMTPAPDAETRRSRVAALLPAIRGELVAGGWPCVLHFDDSPYVLEAIGGERFPEVAGRGVMTPEHILRAGLKPLVVSPHAMTPAGVREAIQQARAQYAAYAASHGQPRPLADFLKTIVLPGLGLVTAGKDKGSARVASTCYRATIQALEGAEAVEEFQFLPEADACEVEYWPLERRKVEEGASRGRELDGKVALIVGAGSGIGSATARLFAREGAHVAAVDVRGADAAQVAQEISRRTPERAVALEADVTDPLSVQRAFRETVATFGGVDVVFYSPGIAPELHGVDEMPEPEAERQMRVHYLGAVTVTREAARAMIAQGTGGRLIYNASKAALAPGEGAGHYGASKAALLHYVRNVANELGRYKITANCINADAVDTPLFWSFVRQRAAQRGESQEQTLARYAERSVMRQAIVPPEAVAEAALWLASGRAGHTTGCVITVGGGAEGFPR